MPDDSKRTNSTETQTEHWRDLADKASKEPDPKKLTEIVEELCEELEEREAKLRKLPTGKA